MSEPTVKDLVYCRLNHEVTFAEFYEKNNKECQTIPAKGSQYREIRIDET
jgi:predicted NUDIX family phosphoesterase